MTSGAGRVAHEVRPLDVQGIVKPPHRDRRIPKAVGNVWSTQVPLPVVENTNAGPRKSVSLIVS